MVFIKPSSLISSARPPMTQDVNTLESNFNTHFSRVGFNVSLDTYQRRPSQPISELVHNTQPSQPVAWLTLTKLNITTTNDNTKSLKNYTAELLTYAQTKTNETEAWFRGLKYHPTRK